MQWFKSQRFVVRVAIIGATVLVLCCGVGVLIPTPDTEETAEPEPAAIAGDSAETEPEPTPEPDEPTPTPAPPTETPPPTETTPPTATPEPTLTPTPVPPAIFEGNSDDVIDLSGFDADLYAVTANYSGSGNFAVTTSSSDGSLVDLLVNTIGAYDGVTLLDMESFTGEVAFIEVSASGPWTIEVSRIINAPSWQSEQSEYTGTGDAVFFIEPSNTGAVSIVGGSSGNFAVIAHTTGVFEVDLLVNEIGTYEGTVIISDNTYLIEVNADSGSKWSFSK